VAGHADNQPISTAQFRSNWELSAFRAAGIARLLAEEGVDSDHLRVESFGSTRPIASNETPEGRAENRRVELFYDRQGLIEEIQRWRSEVAAGGN
jgi:chemotaxis protein MotB